MATGSGILHPADLQDAEIIIADLREEIAALRAQLADAESVKRAAIVKIEAAHAEHLKAIAHGDCISTEAHKRITRELRERART